MQKYLCMSKKSSNFAPKLRIMTKHFAELTTTELYEILKARFAVFYMEQHIYYQDFDDVHGSRHSAYTHEEKTINP